MSDQDMSLAVGMAGFHLAITMSLALIGFPLHAMNLGPMRNSDGQDAQQIIENLYWD